MDGRNRLRFEGNGQELASGLAARAVLGTPRGGSSETPAPPVDPGPMTPELGSAKRRR